MCELQLEFKVDDSGNYPRVQFQIILKGYRQSSKSGMPSLTMKHDVYGEFRYEIERIIKDLRKIDKRAKKKDDAARIRRIQR